MNQSRTFQVLIVEDEPGEARLMQVALRKSGVAIELHEAGDGREALRYLRREGAALAPRPDLILLDLKMPGQSGLEFLARVKQDDDLSAIPVVVVTSSGLNADVLAAYQGGAAGYLPKATDLEQFVAAIHELCQYWFKLVRLPEHQA